MLRHDVLQDAVGVMSSNHACTHFGTAAQNVQVPALGFALLTVRDSHNIAYMETVVPDQGYHSGV